MSQIIEKRERVNRTVALFNARSGHWTSKGFFGGDLYERLAADDVLPENFEPRVIAAILSVQPVALGMQRQRGTGPSFIRLAQNRVIYPRHSFCLYLKDRFVERRPALARDEYTQVPTA